MSAGEAITGGFVAWRGSTHLWGSLAWELPKSPKLLGLLRIPRGFHVETLRVALLWGFSLLHRLIGMRKPLVSGFFWKTLVVRSNIPVVAESFRGYSGWSRGCLRRRGVGDTGRFCCIPGELTRYIRDLSEISPFDGDHYRAGRLKELLKFISRMRGWQSA